MKAVATRLAARQAQTIGTLERIVQRDEGGRGTAHLCRPAGELEKIARALRGANNVTLLTGFPCVENAEVPTETDGPSGTIAVCNALLRGNAAAGVVIMTDECNARVMEACARAGLPEDDGRWRLDVYPPKDRWESEDQQRLEVVAEWSDHILALERASAGPDGFAHTASGRIMGGDMIAPLDQLFEDDMRARYKSYRTTCVGDGGNELGMGSVAASVRAHVKNGDTIVSNASADFLLAASVSNWGGYAIAGALQVLSESDDAFMPTPAEETRMIQAAVDAGAHDGLLMTQTVSVDGLSVDVHCAILDELDRSIRDDYERSGLNG
jgi:hypothetical protein